MKIAIKVIPRASRNSLELLPDGSYKAKLTAAPVDGAANKKLLQLLSKAFGVSTSHIHLIKGETSSNKLIEIIN